MRLTAGLRGGVSLWARRQVSRSSPHPARPPLPKIRLSVSITVGAADTRDKPSPSKTCSGGEQGALSAGDSSLSPDEKTGPGKLN